MLYYIILYSNFCLFRLVFCLFRFNRNIETRFRYRSETTETKVLFRIVAKLVSVVSNRNYFRRTPQSEAKCSHVSLSRTKCIRTAHPIQALYCIRIQCQCYRCPRINADKYTPQIFQEINPEKIASEGTNVRKTYQAHVILMTLFQNTIRSL